MYTRNQLLNIRKINCMATLSEKFETATLVILRCENDATEQDKNKQMKLLYIRAANRGATRFVTGRVYSESGTVKAFHFFSDIDLDAGEKICKRWKLGTHEVRAVDMRHAETFQTELFINNPVPYRAKLYKPNMP